MLRITCSAWCLFIAAALSLVAAEPPKKPDAVDNGATQNAPTWMTAEQIAAALMENHFSHRYVGAFHLYKQPQLNDATLASPLYNAWRGALHFDKPFFETCMRRMGKPMVTYLLSEYKKKKDNDSTLYQALGIMGDAVKSLAPELANNIAQEKLRNESIEVLGKIGETSLPFVKKLLTHPNHIVRGDAMRVMKALGPLAANEWRFVMQVEMAEKESIPGSGLEALGAMGPKARGALSWVNTCLQHTRSETQERAVATLSRIAPNDPRALAALQKLLGDGNPEVRKNGIRLLWKGAFSADVNEKALARLLKDPDITVREFSFYAMLLMDNKPPNLFNLATSVSDQLFEKKNTNPQRRFLEIISLCGPKGADWLADFQLKYISTYDHTEMVDEVLPLLRRMGKDATHVIPKLEKAIEIAKYSYQKEMIKDTLFVLQHADWPEINK